MHSARRLALLFAVLLAGTAAGEPQIRANKVDPAKSIPKPVLDDRNYEALRGELVERTPAHTPEWTNPTEGDPGRSILDVERGTIGFGDGAKGRRPPAGQNPVAGQYRLGSGQADVPGDLRTRGGSAPPFPRPEAAALGTGGLKRMPVNFSVHVDRPAHAGAPARVTARSTGDAVGFGADLLMRISLTCDGNKVVPITPSVHEIPRPIFQPFDPAGQKIIDVMPEGDDWQHPTEGCVYSITARIDPDQRVQEPNEHDNASTAHY